MDTITPHAFTDLGAQEKKPDSRDIPLGAVTATTYNFPASITNTAAWNAVIEYQGQQPACGAHAGSKLNGILTGARYSPRVTWANLKTFDGWAIEDGTDIRSVFKSLTNCGTAGYEPVENDVTLPLSTYADSHVLTQAVLADAAKHKATGYGFITDFTFNGLKQYISQHGPVLLLIRVSERFWRDANGNTSWAEKDILPLAPWSAKWPWVSGHFIVAHSYDENYIYFINSFGSTWGRKGHGYFGADYMTGVVDGGALIKLALDKDLYFGITDPEVKVLQQILNKTPATQVALTGAGSPGNETTYFGGLTQAAVMRFQRLHNITPVQGYVGPLTRAVLNTL